MISARTKAALAAAKALRPKTGVRARVTKFSVDTNSNVEDPLAQIDEPPSQDTMHRRDRAALDYRRKGRPVRVLQLRGLPGSLAVDQPVGPRAVELHHP